MRRRLFVLAGLAALLSGALAGAQQGISGLPGGVAPQPRPSERIVPVGNSTLSGTVLSSDSGRPIKGVRVSVSGTLTLGPEATTAGAGRSGVIGGIPGGVPGGIAGVAAPLPTRGGGLGGPGNGGSMSRTTYTDSNGEFTFPRMPAGRFTVSAQSPTNQFLAINYGEKRSGGQGKTLTLTDNQQMTLKIPMLRGGVISGVVRRPDGEPQGRARIQAWRFDMSMGFRQLQQTGYAESDDRGAYRMHGLRPGEYIIAASPMFSPMDRAITQADEIERAIATGKILPPNAPGFPSTVAVPVPAPPPPGMQPMMMDQPTYLPTYAPSATSPSNATAVIVAGGEEVPNIDIVIRQTQATNIQGTISTPVDPTVQVQIALLSEDASAYSPQPNWAQPDFNTGKFMFRNVAPGKYTLLAVTVPAPPVFVNGRGATTPQPTPTLTDEQKMWGKTQVTVSGEANLSVDIQLKPTHSLSGMVVFEMQRPPDLTRTKMTVMINPAPTRQQMYFGQTPQAQVGPDGRFTLAGVVPGRYIIRANNGFAKSSVINGQDTLDFPFEVTGDQDVTGAVITISDAASELSGTLTDNAGQPASDYWIVAATSDPRYWTPQSRRIILTRPSTEGRYTIRGLPAGSYFVVALSDIEQGEQYDPEFLKSLGASAVQVMVLEGGKVQQDLRIR